MPSHCPSCNSPIPPPDINVQSNTALCRRCGLTTSFSSLVHAPTTGLYTGPPDGCHLETIGGRWRANAFTRSWHAIPLLAFAAGWNSFLVAFATGMISRGAYPCLLLLSLHGAAGIYILTLGLCAALGDIDVTEQHGIIEVSTGIGPARWKRRRLFADITSIRETTIQRGRGGPVTCLLLDGPEPLKFGTQLPEKRRYFLHAAIAAHLAERTQRTHPPIHPN
jgi:hypothetical protein